MRLRVNQILSITSIGIRVVLLTTFIHPNTASTSETNLQSNFALPPILTVWFIG